ncbi:MAG: hypothetical protein PHO83_08635 [Geobacteraceae bacterium]|nr:hypothetical protein [Geobacteraceae bacterium]
MTCAGPGALCGILPSPCTLSIHGTTSASANLLQTIKPFLLTSMARSLSDAG